MNTYNNIFSAKPRIICSCDLFDILDNSILDTMVKTSENEIITTRTYLLHNIFPYVPKFCFIFSNDDEVIKIDDFISNGVLGTCQDEYNGDFKKFYFDNFKLNPGIIRIKEKEDSFWINSNTISNYIDPSITNTNISFKTNNFCGTCSFGEFIDQVYSKYMPFDGIVNLSSYKSITIKEFIENVLFPAYNSNYEGTLEDFLFSNSRMNNGNLKTNADSIEKIICDLKKKKEILATKKRIIVKKRG